MSACTHQSDNWYGPSYSCLNDCIYCQVDFEHEAWERLLKENEKLKKIVQVAEQIDCDCSVLQRLSGHLSYCRVFDLTCVLLELKND